MTNNYVTLNVIAELVIGYALPHHPVAMMMFKTWGYIAMYQALYFTAYLKVGHYMKIPHRPMFFSLLIGTIIQSTVQLGVQAWMFSHVEDICTPNQPDNFICPYANTFGSSSIIVSSHSHGLFQFLTRLCIPSGVPLGQSVSFLTVTSTTTFSSSSSWVLLHHLSSGRVTRSSS